MAPYLKGYLKAFIEAADSIKSNKETSLITLFTIAVAVSILGLFLLVYFNFSHLLRNWSEQLQVIVYLEDDIQKEDLKNIEVIIQSEERIWRWDYLSKKDALRTFQKQLKGKSNILEGLDSNPLPASFNIYFKEDFRNHEEIQQLAEEFSEIPGVEGVDYGGEWIARFEAAVLFLRIFITAVGGLLGMGLIAIISNTIRLSVYSRADEIEIKKLVGATRWFIQAPFLIEGVAQGIFGVLLALGLLFLFYLYFLIRLAANTQILMGISAIFIPTKILFLLLLMGGLIGGVGSFLSLGKLMRFDKSN